MFSLRSNRKKRYDFRDFDVVCLLLLYFINYSAEIIGDMHLNWIISGM